MTHFISHLSYTSCIVRVKPPNPDLIYGLDYCIFMVHLLFIDAPKLVIIVWNHTGDWKHTPQPCLHRVLCVMLRLLAYLGPAANVSTYLPRSVDLQLFLVVTQPFCLHAGDWGWRFGGDKKCDLNNPDIVGFALEMKSLPSAAWLLSFSSKKKRERKQQLRFLSIQRPLQTLLFLSERCCFVNYLHFSVCAFPLVVLSWPESRKLLWPAALLRMPVNNAPSGTVLLLHK